jgi:hypothetical protein
MGEREDIGMGAGAGHGDADVYRTRFLGHLVWLRGHGHGRKLVLAA